jgi:foldase protein PrsA
VTSSRPIRALLALLVAVVLGACSDDDDGASGSGAPPAAVVGGSDIPADVLVDEVEAIAANAPYVEAFEEAAASGGGTMILADEGDGDEFVTQFVTDTLGVRIQYQIVGEEVERRDLEVTDACTELAREALVGRFTAPEAGLDGEEILAAFGEDYSDYLVERQAAFFTLRADLAGVPCGGETSDEAVQAYFDANEAELSAETACASHILVETREEADEIVALLASGEDFATLATERSQDPQSGAAGGELGCAPAGQYVEPFDDAVFAQPVGEVGEPVETEFGFHVILVTERGAPTAEELRAEIEAALGQELEAAFGTWFTEALETTEVTVDSRYGDWDPTSASVVRPAPGSGAVITDSGEG